MKQGQIPKRRRYPQLLKEYAQILEQRVQKGKIKEGTLTQSLNDAQVVMGCLVAACQQTTLRLKSGCYIGATTQTSSKN